MNRSSVVLADYTKSFDTVDYETLVARSHHITVTVRPVTFDFPNLLGKCTFYYSSKKLKFLFLFI